MLCLTGCDGETGLYSTEIIIKTLKCLQLLWFKMILVPRDKTGITKLTLLRSSNTRKLIHPVFDLLLFHVKEKWLKIWCFGGLSVYLVFNVSSHCVQSVSSLFPHVFV